MVVAHISNCILELNTTSANSPNDVPTLFQILFLVYVSGVSLGILFEYLDQRFKEKSLLTFEFQGSLYKALALIYHLVCTAVTIKTDNSRICYVILCYAVLYSV